MALIGPGLTTGRLRCCPLHRGRHCLSKPVHHVCSKAVRCMALLHRYHNTYRYTHVCWYILLGCNIDGAPSSAYFLLSWGRDWGPLPPCPLLPRCPLGWTPSSRSRRSQRRAELMSSRSIRERTASTSVALFQHRTLHEHQLISSPGTQAPYSY